MMHRCCLPIGRCAASDDMWLVIRNTASHLTVEG